MASLLADGAIAARLRRELEGEVLFDPFTLGRYSTDASHYQIEPLGVVVPKSEQDIVTAVAIAREGELPILLRGAGTSQCGQTVGRALVLDVSKYLNHVIHFEPSTPTVSVQPGIVLEHLNRHLKPHGVFFPVDVSTASRATIGGMTGNNSCGSRSIRYGNMVHNVRSIDAVLATGDLMRFREVPGNLGELEGGSHRDIVQRLRALAARETDEIHARFPKLQRRVGGYNIDDISPTGHNMARMLVGSEGTLAAFTRIELDLQPIPAHKALGVCHFPNFYSAMDSAQHIVELHPSAVELVDRTMIDLAREIPLYRDTVKQFVRGEPDAILLVEFAGEDYAEQIRGLDALEDLMGSLGFPNAFVKATDAGFQNDIWEVRKAGLNIMMSMKGDGKPISFIEDCAVPLEDLADYTDRLTRIFAKHGTSGTWYAHASVGCLHVRPVLNLKDGRDVQKMRAIAEEAFEMVREYKGSHSGEHGDGLVRSEFHEAMFGERVVQAFEEVKDIFDPGGLFNPGKIVNPSRMDDRSLFRFKPHYKSQAIDTGLDWSEWNGFASAVEMCNNNGACRKLDAGVMCPSYRATRDEQHLTRGRANTLRLAISGQLGPDALASDEMYETMDLCVGCKGCKRECPTGVDMARMKVEFLFHYRKRHGLPIRDRLIAYLPRYAPRAAPLAALLNLRDSLPGLPHLTQKFLGLSAKRTLPVWKRNYFRASEVTSDGTSNAQGNELVLLADTFNTYFEPENIRSAIAVFQAAGYRVHVPRLVGEQQPLCCGRTFLAAGLIDEAKAEAQRTIDALTSYVANDLPIVGLEPSCLYTLRDEFVAMLPGKKAESVAKNALLFEEFLAKEEFQERFSGLFKSIPTKQVIVHGHCHQKAFSAMGAVERTLQLVPDLEIEIISSSCCGMAGSFGYDAEHYGVSMQMGELDLLPAVRNAAPGVAIAADGTSCRHQILHGTKREALHVARILASALA